MILKVSPYFFSLRGRLIVGGVLVSEKVLTKSHSMKSELRASTMSSCTYVILLQMWYNFS